VNIVAFHRGTLELITLRAPFFGLPFDNNFMVVRLEDMNKASYAKREAIKGCKYE
jgi:hypothetical protein